MSHEQKIALMNKGINPDNFPSHFTYDDIVEIAMKAAADRGDVDAYVECMELEHAFD